MQCVQYVLLQRIHMSYTRIFPPNGAQADTGGSAGNSSDKTVVRNLLVHISGNRATWESIGIHGAVWRVNPEHAESIFAYSTEAGGCCKTTTDSLVVGKEDRISRAMIKKVSILESNTNIEEPIGIIIDGLPHKEFTSNGSGVSCFLTGSGRVTTPQEVFCLSGNTELGMAWMQQYPQYTSENLESQGVMFLTGATYYFVHEGHPAIQMLRSTQEDVGVQVSADAEGQWYKVEVVTFMICVKTLREGVLMHTPSTFNLANLTVRLCKPDRQGWLYISPQSIDQLVGDHVKETRDPNTISQAKKLVLQRYLDRPLTVTMRLSIEYTLPDSCEQVGQLMMATTSAAPPSAQLQSSRH